MKSSGESLRYLEAAGRNRLSLFRDTTIGTWNMRTMFQSGNAVQIAAEMRRYNKALLGRRKWRWIGHTFRKPVVVLHDKQCLGTPRGKGEEAG